MVNYNEKVNWNLEENTIINHHYPFSPFCCCRCQRLHSVILLPKGHIMITEPQSVSWLIDWLLLLLPILTPLSAPTRGNNSIAISGFCFVCNCSCKIVNCFYFMKFEIMYKVLLEYLHVHSLLFFSLGGPFGKTGSFKVSSPSFCSPLMGIPMGISCLTCQWRVLWEIFQSPWKGVGKNKEHNPLLE